MGGTQRTGKQSFDLTHDSARFSSIDIVIHMIDYSSLSIGGSCQENIYLEVGKQGVVPCHIVDFNIFGWINGHGDVTKTPPFIYMEGSQIHGQGYKSGDYDMHPNGSLIINEVNLTNEVNYTVLFIPHHAGEHEYFRVPVKVYVSPDLGYPLVNGRTNQVIVHGNTKGFINCSLTSIRPRVHLEWVASPDEISLNNSHRVTDNNDGTYNTYLTSSYKVVNSPTGRVSLICRVAGYMADLFPSVTTVYLLLELRFPAVNGMANQQHVVLHVNREGELTCSMDKVSRDISLELVKIFPDSSDEVLLDNKHHITANGDDTVNVTLTSRFWVLSASIQHFTLQCSVSGQAASIYPEVTTVELLVSENFPVINGLVNQQHVVLNVNREDKLTCTMKRVSQSMVLEWVFTPPVSPNKISIENELSKTDNRDGTSNITLSSSFRVLKKSIQHVTLECRVVDENDGSQHDVTTVELLFDKNFPVVNGLVHQQHVVLNVNREDKLTCTMNRVSQTMVLKWVFTPPVSPDKISIENELSKTDNRDGTSNITVSSNFHVLKKSIQYVTLECRVVDENDGSQHDVTTVELLFDKIADQECESLLNWQPTLTIVLLVFLVVNVIIFWLIIVFWRKRHKDFARKYHRTVANPGQQIVRTRLLFIAGEFKGNLRSPERSKPENFANNNSCEKLLVIIAHGGLKAGTEAKFVSLQSAEEFCFSSI
ncbi:hypothetical protein BSL78_00576 [Apostichopus japonicus]|uniref:Ig-like domain-containing protein n=1 Tax=Stichopus japonicus TaxID=307972 RepID=A0A2G8LQE5_STIJA|nr:hypothetical protein BSL78_00576 [Apostichopus japonicus]